jgi:transcriptional regulator with XRE-family HTH domain
MKSFGNIEDSNVPANARSDFGDKLRSARLKAGYSIEQVALTCGLTEFEIAKIESGRTADRLHLLRVGRVLKLMPVELQGAYD